MGFFVGCFMIFWILFVWLPLVLYVLQFWKYRVNWPNVSFSIKEEFEMVFFLLIPTNAVISLCFMLDIAIEERIWDES